MGAKLTRLFTRWLALIACTTWALPVHAGSVELFRNAQLHPTDANQLIAPYIFGGGGLFVSSDGGKSFGLTCSTATSPDLRFEREISQIAVSAAGHIYIGLFNGLWRGGADGCSFAQVPELSGNIIGALAVDPTDPKRVYVGTSNGYTEDNMPRLNNLWLNDGSSNEFEPVSKEDLFWYSNLHVVKRGAGRRLYATGVRSKLVKDESGVTSSEAHYYVRVSDDDAKTWIDHEYDLAQYGPAHRTSEFSIVAVDPADPERIIGVVARDALVDSVVYSTQQGEPGSWQLLSEVGDLQSAVFGPGGKLYFGDHDQSSRAFYVVDQLGEAPRKISESWKVGCLRWDAAHSRMLACKDWQFGTVDLESGAFSPLLDMRCAERFAECPDQGSVRDACTNQLLTSYCKSDHYPLAPLCASYARAADWSSYVESFDYTCKDGFAVSKSSEGGAAGSAGVGGSAGTPSAGGMPQPAGAATSSGCACSLGTRARPLESWALWLVPLAALGARRLKRRRLPQPRSAATLGPEAALGRER